MEELEKCIPIKDIEEIERYWTGKDGVSSLRIVIDILELIDSKRFVKNPSEVIQNPPSIPIKDIEECIPDKRELAFTHGDSLYGSEWNDCIKQIRKNLKDKAIKNHPKEKKE